MPPKGSTKAAAPPVDLSELTAAVIQQKSNTASIADFELPKTSLTKLAKGSVSLLFLLCPHLNSR